jgi:hypothetical protein
MKWLRNLWATRPVAFGSSRWYELRAELDRNERAEDIGSRMMGTFMGAKNVNDDLDRIFALRERRVEILRQLGWRKEARKLAADTAMRRAWGPVR